MNLIEAAKKAFSEGKRITSKRHRVSMSIGVYGMDFEEKGRDYPYSIDIDDIVADDWEVAE